MNKRELANLVMGIVSIVIFSTTLIIVIHRVQASDVATQGYQFDLYADHHTQYYPVLYINHSEGQPGSYFRVWGHGYPAYDEAAIIVNGHYMTGILVDGFGYFNFQFSTTFADDGVYVIDVTVNPSAATQFVIDSSSPNLWDAESGQSLFSVPQDIALTKFLYLPVIILQ